MTATSPRSSGLRIWADLSRAGNFPSVASNVLAALVLSQPDLGQRPHLSLVLVTMLGGVLAYAGGATLNDVADARFDAAHRPERPLPRQVISRRNAAVLGLLQLAGGAGLLVWLGAGIGWALGLVAVVAAYDWLHKRWAGSVVLMGACRVALAVTVASLPGHGFTPQVLGWIGALFVYIVGLSVLARREYALGRSGDPAAAARAERVGRRVGQMLALIPFVDGIALLLVGASGPALACALAMPLGRLAQRVAAST